MFLQYFDSFLFLFISFHINYMINFYIIFQSKFTPVFFYKIFSPYDENPLPSYPNNNAHKPIDQYIKVDDDYIYYTYYSYLNANKHHHLYHIFSFLQSHLHVGNMNHIVDMDMGDIFP